MKTLLFFTFFSLTCQCLFGQNRKLSDEELNNSTISKIRFADTISCEKIDEWLKSDIKNKTIFLFFSTGIAPTNLPGDKKFEDKYHVYFYDFGDLPPDYKCMIKYDCKVFDYLTSVYGKQWEREIRKDVIGFSEWKKIQ